MSVFLFPFLFFVLFLLPDLVEGVVPLLERLFGVKRHEITVSFRVWLSGRYYFRRKEWIVSV